MASEYKRILYRLEALEESVSLLDNVAARKSVVEERLGWHVDRMNRLEGRVQTAEALLRDAGRKFDALEARLASKPDDFGGVTSTGAPKTMTRWVIVSCTGRVFSADGGFAERGLCAMARCFESEEKACIARDLIFEDRAPLYTVEEVDVVQCSGIGLVEARYA